jgi:6-pyruvoyltetrahydropterin/6-carboxytetrahydropterin synthase
MIRISKKFDFEMGHRLDGHKGLCNNIHGHSYTIETVFEGDIIEKENSSSNGMVMDYGDMKKVVKGFIDEFLEHSVMVYSKDEEWKKFLKKNGFKCTIVPFRVTAENMCVWIFDALSKTFQKVFTDGLIENKDARMVGIRMWETKNSMAEYFPENLNTFSKQN